MVSKFLFCQGSFSYQLQQETRVYFLPDFSAKINPKIKQRFTLSIPSVDDYIYPEKILLTSKFSFFFSFGATPPIFLTETGTANSWETTNNKPPGRIIMIDQLERGSTNQIIFITLSYAGVKLC
jgi:hypothetical protein